MLVSVAYEMYGNSVAHYSQVVALYDGLAARLLGISLASFSSGNPVLLIVIRIHPHFW